MRLFSLAPLLFLSVAAASTPAAAIDQRATDAGSAAAAQAISKSANRIITTISTVGRELTDFKPGSVLPKQVRDILDGEMKIQTELQGTVKEAQRASRFSAAQARRVKASIAMLEPGFDALGDNLESHKKSFQTVTLVLNFSKKLAKILTAQRAAVQSLGKQLERKVPARQRADVASSVSAISARLEKTVQVFSK